MATIQIRNVSPEDYEALRDAAKAAGMSLQTYMQEQASTLARRTRKRAAFDAARDAVEQDNASGVTTDSLLAELDAIRGPWPEQEERGAARA